MMPFRSRQAKKASRVFQQALRALRLGASKAPSGEALGDVWLWEGAGEEEEKRPMGGGW